MERIIFTLPPTFLEHLMELRHRLFWSAVIFVGSSILGYFLHETLLFLLERPLDQPLFYTSPAGGLNFIIKTSLFFGFIVSLPVFIYHILKFIQPALPYNARHYFLQFLIASCVLLLLGIMFAYSVSLPAALGFLSTFGSGHIQALISADEYFSFSTRYLAGFGILFQLPLILFLINKITPLTIKKLLTYEKYVLFFSFLLAAIITPTPDLVNQALMAIPLILLYQLSIIFLWFMNIHSSQKHAPAIMQKPVNRSRLKKKRKFFKKTPHASFSSLE